MILDVPMNRHDDDYIICKRNGYFQSNFESCNLSSLKALIGSSYDVPWCIIFANVVERRSGSEIKEVVDAEENDEHYEQEHNIVKTNIFWFIAYAPFTQVDLNVVYRDNTGYDQGGMGSGWSPVPGGKMRLVMTNIRCRIFCP